MARYIDADKLTYSRVSIIHSDGTIGGWHAVVMSSVIKDAPAADVVEVRHGEWIIEHDPINDPKKYFIRIVCSCCGLKTGQVSNFCPMCGAKMDATDNNVGDKERKDKP